MSAATAPVNLGPTLVPPAREFKLEAVSVRLPRMAVGYVLAGICLMAEIGLFTGIKSVEARVVALVAGLLGSGYWLFCVHRIHRITAQATSGAYPISPRRALWFHFIPIFSLYWYFRWPYRLAKFINQTQPSVRVSRFWPALLILLGMLLGNTSLGLFLIFGTGAYLTRKLSQIVPFTTTEQADRVTTTEQVDRGEQFGLAVSAGLGAGFALLLGKAVSEAVPRFLHETSPTAVHDLVVETLSIALVSLGIAWFVEPVLDALRAVCGLPAHHPLAEPRKTWIPRIVIALFLVLATVSHELLHDYIRNNFRPAFSALVAMLLVSGGITYAWVNGARRRPARAGGFGLMSGASTASLLILVLWPAVGSTVSANVQSVSQAMVQGTSGPLVPLLMASQISLGSIAIPLMLWGLFGLAGGMAIDRKWTIAGAPQVAIVMSVLTTTALALLALFIASRAGIVHYDELVGAKLTVGLSSIVGWCAGLLICPACKTLLSSKPLPTSSVEGTDGLEPLIQPSVGEALLETAK